MLERVMIEECLKKKLKIRKIKQIINMRSSESKNKISFQFFI